MPSPVLGDPRRSLPPFGRAFHRGRASLHTVHRPGCAHRAGDHGGPVAPCRRGSSPRSVQGLRGIRCGVRRIHRHVALSPEKHRGESGQAGARPHPQDGLGGCVPGGGMASRLHVRIRSRGDDDDAVQGLQARCAPSFGFLRHGHRGSRLGRRICIGGVQIPYGAKKSNGFAPPTRRPAASWLR